VKESLRRQIVDGLSGAEFPIKSPEELLSAFPQGAETTCTAGDVSLKAGDAGKVLTGDDLPLGTAVC